MSEETIVEDNQVALAMLCLEYGYKAHDRRISLGDVKKMFLDEWKREESPTNKLGSLAELI
jgi:hypothetical protein